jgi:hypothetical protein
MMLASAPGTTDSLLPWISTKAQSLGGWRGPFLGIPLQLLRAEANAVVRLIMFDCSQATKSTESHTARYWQ